jgi:hypothetical protein
VHSSLYKIILIILTLSYIHTAVIASLERTEYFVSESEGCLEVCVRLVGRYQSSITVYLCIEGINATGMRYPTVHKLGSIVTV